MRKFWSTMMVLAVVGVIGVGSAFADDAPKKGEKKRERPSLEQIFKKLDADSDGSLTVAELAKSPRLKGDEAKAKAIIEKMDGNEDGKVCGKEFAGYIKKMHARHHKHGEHKKGEHKRGEHKRGERKEREKECKKPEAKKECKK